jgi:predicted dienelactone hydrolase
MTAFRQANHEAPRGARPELGGMSAWETGKRSMVNSYANESEAALHEAAIDAIANEMHRSAAEIKPFYEKELFRLMDGARVRDFLSVCATRHLRQTLRERHG